MTEWQPIDTAPAGTDILLCFSKDTQRVGYFNGRHWLQDGEPFDWEPTHRMALPPPPSEVKE